MARHYQRKDFLRHAPKELLYRYLSNPDLGFGLPVEKFEGNATDLIFAEINQLSFSLQTRIDRDLGDINNLADPGGRLVLIHQANDAGTAIQIIKTIGSMKSDLEAAFWMFQEHNDLFEESCKHYRADTAARWRTVDKLPEVSPRTDDESAENLKQEISDYFRTTEGRAQTCHVDHMRLDDNGTWCWYVYCNDFAQGHLTFTDDRRLDRQTLQPTFSVIFVYCPTDRTLRVSVRGNADVFTKLKERFGDIILGTDLTSYRLRRYMYNLNLLLDPTFDFRITRPDDGIEEIHVRRLCFEIPSWPDKRIILEAGGRRASTSIYEMLDKTLKGLEADRESVAVVQAGLQAILSPVDGKKPRTTSFEISQHAITSLKSEARYDGIRRCLRRCGIDTSGRAGSDSSNLGDEVQRCLPRQ